MHELFSGTGDTSKALRRLGVYSKEWDATLASCFDFSDMHVVCNIIRDLRYGAVAALFLAIHCATISLAGATI